MSAIPINRLSKHHSVSCSFKTIQKQNMYVSIAIVLFTMYSVYIYFRTNIGVRATGKNTIIIKPYI